LHIIPAYQTLIKYYFNKRTGRASAIAQCKRTRDIKTTTQACCWICCRPTRVHQLANTVLRQPHGVTR